MGETARRKRATDQENWRGDTAERQERDKKEEQSSEKKSDQQIAEETVDIIRKDRLAKVEAELERRKGAKGMSMIDFDEFGLPEAEEPEVVPEGEYKVRIVSVSIEKDKNGCQYFSTMMEIPDNPRAKDVYDLLYIPSGMNAKTRGAKMTNLDKWRLKTFCEAFSLSLTGSIDPADDWPGSEGWVQLNTRDDTRYGKSNRVKEYIRPR